MIQYQLDGQLRAAGGHEPVGRHAHRRWCEGKEMSGERASGEVLLRVSTLRTTV